MNLHCVPDTMSAEPSPAKWKSIVVALVGLVFCGIGIFGLREKAALEKSNSVVDASITESRIMRTKYALSHEVRYEFKLTPDSSTHTRGDFLGRSNLWSTLPESDWNKATAEGRLAVRYNPADPENNAPQVAMPKSSDCWTLIVLGGVLLIGVFLVEKSRRKPPIA